MLAAGTAGTLVAGTAGTLVADILVADILAADMAVAGTASTAWGIRTDGTVVAVTLARGPQGRPTRQRCRGTCRTWQRRSGTASRDPQDAARRWDGLRLRRWIAGRPLLRARGNSRSCPTG